MSAQANIVIADSAAANHTFNPKGAKTSPDKKSMALWRDQSVAQAIGYLSIREEWSPANSNGIQKVRYVIDVPTLEEAAGGGSFVPPPTKAYSTIAMVEVLMPDRASTLELQNIAAYVKNFTALAYFSDAISKREPAW